uniref:AB hydrolase-1 domain-containing protein n=1 Tax=Corethron hystrix TaxID=216773 RepID=A0A7S1B6F3_9STRA|mmetsp:Transcript_14794/g.32771  ORF Transcript_14794/g.32771 Transcript_14794/m.32771 type:complete len:163 (+) Transcript_14794:193-681(+)
MRFHLVPSLLLVLSCWFSSAFVPPSDSPRPPSSSLSARLGPTRYHLDASSRRCAYRVAPPAPGFESAPSLLLIHPIGIGCASWFWDPFVRAWSGNRLLVPDLIGCGASDRFDPRESGMFVPLDWTRQLEDLCREESKGRGQVVAVSQGGMAPVALSLATRQR